MHRFEREVGDLSGLPAEVSAQVIEAMDEVRRDRLALWEKLRQGRQSLDEAYLRDLRGVVGGGNWPRYQRLHDRRVREVRRLKERLGSSPQDLPTIKDKTRRNVRESHRLIRRCGIDEDRVRSLRRGFQQQVAGFYSDFLPSPVVSGEVPDEETRRDWTILQPPYLVSESEIIVYSSDSGPDQMARARSSRSGQMSHESRSRSDGGPVLLWMYTDVAVVLKISPGGRPITVRAGFRTGHSDHAICAGDANCGFHSAYVSHYLTGSVGLKPLWPTGDITWRTATLGGVGLIVQWPEDCNGVYERLWRPGEAIRTADLVFPGSYPDQQYMMFILSFGSKNDPLLVDDMNVQSYLYETMDVLNISLSIG